jgi:hypothetical protein
MSLSARMLLKVPPVRRVIARLVNAEAAIADQQAELGAVDKRIASLSDSLNGLSEGLNEELARLADSIRSMRENLSFQRSVTDEIAKHMPPDRRTALEAQVHALNSMIPALNTRVDRLFAEQARGQLPPEQREALKSQAVAFNEIAADTANLEATLHGQQLQLGAINSTIFANQVNLAELNTAVDRLSKTVATNSDLSATVADLQRKNRLLRVGHGATFDELIVARKLSTAKPYRFEDLLAFSNSKKSLPTVPPLVFMHIPKTGGTTLNNILMKNYRYRMDSYGGDFFPRYFPDEFVSLVRTPEADDSRRPVFFTGHIDVSNDLFRYMPERYVVITMLRDPVDRIISHYRFHSTLSDSPLGIEIAGGLNILDYFDRFREAIPLQYESLVPRNDKAPQSNSKQVDEALRNLESNISLFGLQEEFDAFVISLARLLGLPHINYSALNQTPPTPVKVTSKQAAKLRELLALDIAFYEAAAKLYRKRKASLAFDIDAKVKAFKSEQNAYSRRRNTGTHQWARYYS